MAFRHVNLVIESVVSRAMKRPGVIIAFWFVVAVFLSPSVFDLRIETSTESVLERDSEAWRFYQRAQEMFGGDEVLVVMLRASRPFDPPVLRDVIQLTQEFYTVEGIRRVDSLASVPLVRASETGEVSLASALSSGVPSDPEARESLAHEVLRDRIAPRNLVSEDGKAFSLNLLLREGASERYGEILASIRRSIEGKDASISGVPIFRVEAARETRADLMRFVPLTVAGIAALLFVLFRRLVAVLVPLACSGLASWVMLAVMSFSGRPLTITTVILPSLLLGIGCAYGIHLLSSASGEKEGLAIRLVDVARPIALSGFTTAVGFFAVSFVEIDAIRDVGQFGALGVGVLVATTLSLGPAILGHWTLGVRRVAGRRMIEERVAPYLFSVVYWRRVSVVVVWLGVTVVVGFGISQLNVETDVVRWFPKESDIRQDYRAIRSKLSGISPMNVVLMGDAGRSVTETGVMNAVSGLSEYVESLPEVGKTVAIADLVAQIHEGFVGERYGGFPGERALTEQYLLLLESKEQVRDLVTPARDATNVLVRVDNNGSSALLEVAEKAESWWEQNGAPGFRARTTGVMYEFARAEEEISYGQLRGLAFAFVVMAVILFFVFGSVSLTLFGLIPNVAPLAIAFGLMGLLNIPLDAGTVLLGNLAFGIAVDDTMHTLLRFRQLRAREASDATALAGSFRIVLPPLIYSTGAVTIGFAVLGVSDFLLTQRLGLMTGGVMVLCLLADVLLLPALIMGVGARRATGSVGVGVAGEGGSWGEHDERIADRGLRG